MDKKRKRKPLNQNKMPDTVTKRDMEQYLETARTWLSDFETYVENLPEGNVDIGSNPPVPPPRPPGI